MPRLRATTILAVRHRGGVAIGGDGQVTLGNIVMKGDAHKIRRLHGGRVMTGFADGHVGFIKNSISFQVYRALFSRNRGEVLSSDSY